MNEATQRKTIALIGNGPISRSASKQIDNFDLVVRMNYARFCGTAGKRTDVLVLRGVNAANFIYNRPINRRAAIGAKQIWFTAVNGTNAVLEGINRLIVKGRPRVFLGTAIDIEAGKTLADLAGTSHVVPSAGATTLFYLLRAYPEHEVTLFGFTHQGWDGHAWNAEAAWMDDLVAKGKVRRARHEPPFVRDPIVERIRREPIRAFRFFRRLMQGRA